MSEQLYATTPSQNDPGGPVRKGFFVRVFGRSLFGGLMMIVLLIIFVGFIGYFFYAAGFFSENTRSAKAPLPKIASTPGASPTTPKPASPLAANVARPLANAKKISTTQVKMKTTRMVRFDKKSRTYIIQSASARRHDKKPNLIFLTKVVSEIRMPNNKDKIFVTADRGIFNSKTDEMDLMGNIKVKSESGYRANLHTAHIWLKQGRIVSNRPVKVFMSQGVVVANGVEAFDGGAKIRFLKRAIYEQK